MRALSKVGCKKLCIFLLLGLFEGVTPSRAEVDWPHVELESVTTFPNGVSPTQITNASDGSGRLFLVRRSGVINHFLPGNPGAVTTFLEIQNRVLSNSGEQGLLSLAFPPDFSTSRVFYVNYTRNPDGATVVSRFTLGANGLGNPATEQILLTIPRTANYHNGGQIAFGPDGYLYIASGDGGTDNLKAQDPSSLLGKILRIKPEAGANYSIPTNNPFRNTPGYKPEIWMLGCRNPWRFSFDKQTGELYVADVGEYRQEEINVFGTSESGRNLGWPYFEGSEPFLTPAPGPASNYRPPELSLSHQYVTTLIGGHVYRGPQFPGDSRLNGAYVFADYSRGGIYAAAKDGTVWDSRKIASTSMHPTSLGEGENGDIYVIGDGGLYRVLATGKAHTPEVDLYENNYYFEDKIATITCLGTGVRIHYTTELREPTEVDPYLVSGDKLLINGTRTYRFKAFKEGFLPSETVQRTYVMRAQSPVFSRSGGAYFNDSSLTLTTPTKDGKIHYTTTGAEPTPADPYVLSGGSMLLDHSVTIKAKTFKGDYTPSGTEQQTFNFRVSNPYFIQPGVMSDAGLQVSISPLQTTDAIVRYTTDGTTPTAESPVLPSPLLITATTKITLIAMNGRYPDSDAVPFYFGMPVFRPNFVSLSYAGSYNQLGYVDGPRKTARFSNLGEICADGSGNLFVVDTGSLRIRKIDAAGNVSTYAGNGQPGSANGPRLQARFDRPSGICIDSSGNLYVAEWAKLRRIAPDGVVSTMAALPEASSYHLAAAPDGKIYIGYSLTGYDGYLLRYVPGETSVTNFAMTTSLAGHTEVAVDSVGNVYASTRGGIARFTPDGTYSQYAGRIAEDYNQGDGPLGTASFVVPTGMAFDAEGTLILSGGNSVRAIRDGSVETLVGGRGSTSPEGIGSVVSPWITDLCVTSGGRIFAVSSNSILMVAASPDVDNVSVPVLLEEDRPPYVVGADDREEDTDGDGYSNALELQLGMDPTVFNPTSPQLTVNYSNNQPRQLQWKGTTWAQQQVYYSSNMVDWKSLAIGSRGEFSRADIPMSLWEESRLFFKIVTKP